VYQNVWRDFQVIAARAKVPTYPKPIHSLRKSCITDRSSRFLAHVVKEWAGHADIRTTLKYYLKVSEAEYEKAARETTAAGHTQLVAQLAANPPSDCRKSKAGVRIRTGDVQLGKTPRKTRRKAWNGFSRWTLRRTPAFCKEIHTVAENCEESQ
jgi:hypothetical protein